MACSKQLTLLLLKLPFFYFCASESNFPRFASFFFSFHNNKTDDNFPLFAQAAEEEAKFFFCKKQPVGKIGFFVHSAKPLKYFFYCVFFHSQQGIFIFVPCTLLTKKNSQVCFLYVITLIETATMIVVCRKHETEKLKKQTFQEISQFVNELKGFSFPIPSLKTPPIFHFSSSSFFHTKTFSRTVQKWTKN